MKITKKHFALIFVFLILLIPQATSLDLELNSRCEYDTEGSHVSQVVVSDLGEDRGNEAFVGSKDGVLYTLDEQCQRQWQHIKPEDGITDFQIIDFTNNTQKNILISSLDESRGFTVLKNDYTEIYQPREDLDPITSFDTSDLDGDGKLEVVLASKVNKLIIMEQVDSPSMLKLETEKEIKTDYPLAWIEATDLDMDDSVEIIALGNDAPDVGKIYVYNSEGKLKWEQELSKGVYQPRPHSIEIEDVNGDQVKEILVGEWDNRLLVLDSYGNKEFEFSTDRLVSAVHVTDLEEDGEKEILAASYPNLYLLNSEGEKMWEAETDSSVLSMKTLDLNNDGIKEIITGQTRGVAVYDQEGEKSAFWGIEGDEKFKEINVKDLWAGNLDQNIEKEIVAVLSWTETRLETKYKQGRVRILDIDTEMVTTTTSSTSTSTTETTTVSSTSSTMATTSTEPAKSASSTSTTFEPTEGSHGFGLPVPRNILFLILGLGAIVLLGILILAVALFYLYKRSKETDGSGEDSGEEENLKEAPRSTRGNASEEEGLKKAPRSTRGNASKEGKEGDQG